MARPPVSAVAERLYAALGAQTDGDEAGGWLLLHLCHAVTVPIAEVDDLASDSDAGAGWSALLDPDRAPARFLGYLAQYAGVELAPGLPDAAQRERIRSVSGWQRGTPAAIVAAARQWLSGEQDVTLVERHNGSAYRIRVQVYEAQATDVQQLARAVAAAVPAGIVAEVDVRSGWSYQQGMDAYPGATYAAVQAPGALGGQTYDQVRKVIP